MSKRGQLIIYSGPSGVGKGTIVAPLLTPEGPLVASVSATTRPPREGEQNGVHYHFVTEKQFEKMIARDELLEYAVYNGQYYGTPRAFVEQQLEKGLDVILEIEVQGAQQLQQRCPDALMIFVMPPSYDELRRRLIARGTETEAHLSNRLAAALIELQQAAGYDFIVINDDLEQARHDLLDAIHAGRLLTRHHKKLINEVLHQC